MSTNLPSAQLIDLSLLEGKAPAEPESLGLHGSPGGSPSLFVGNSTALFPFVPIRAHWWVASRFLRLCLLPYQRGDCHRNRYGVGQRSEHVRRADLREQRLTLLIQPDQGFVPGTMINGNGAPAQLGADARRESFRDRLLRGKPRRQVQVRMLVTEAIRALLLGENPLEKTVPLPVKHATDPFHLDDIATEAEHLATRRKNNIHF